MTEFEPLVDSFGRRHTSLRISVTDRCNIRCFYCMPDENIRFKPQDELLTFEEIERFTRIVAKMGVSKLRITGGEPLVRSNLSYLIERLVAIPGIVDVALTTNGILLADHVAALKNAGLHRLNISLDGLTEETFERIARRSGLDRVLAGIFKAQEIGFEKIRLNAVSIKGITENEVIPLGEFARQHDLELRFIEFMPLDAENQWQSTQVLCGEEIRAQLEETFGPLLPSPRGDLSQPSMDFHFADGLGRIGFINPVSQPFCSNCNRLRITAEGAVRNCLFSLKEWSVRSLLRDLATDDEIADVVRDAVRAKKTGHGIDSPDFEKPDLAMYQIGG
ncbi:MAG: GTP 3',8-cyclase MoaA [Pirellulaceae bacterium]|nr:GTP 3',8-cyclase MoaA [Pirellulaceae bacterium]